MANSAINVGRAMAGVPAILKNKGGGDSKMHAHENYHSTAYRNVVAAKSVADALRTSLGPRGMDKMIQDESSNVVITNDGATILSEMKLSYPTARMMVELSRAQDAQCGDGTTTVVVLCGAILDAALHLLDRGFHAQLISRSVQKLKVQILTSILPPLSRSFDLRCKNGGTDILSKFNTDALLQSARTSLNSKVVSSNADLLSDIAVRGVLRLVEKSNSLERCEREDGGLDINLDDIRVVPKLGGTLENCELIPGLVFNQKFCNSIKVNTSAQDCEYQEYGDVRTIRELKEAKVGLIQFCISAPKTNMDNSISIQDYQSMDRLLKEERILTAKMVKKIQASGCNVLLVQKSILREAVSNLALDYLSKANILVLKNIERDDIEFISKALGCQPVASLDAFNENTLAKVGLVREDEVGGSGRIVKMTLCQSDFAGSTVLVRASNALLLDEAVRSLHDCLCVVRSLIRKPALLPGGGACESEIAQKAGLWARKGKDLDGREAVCVEALAEAFQSIPFAIAQNSALKPLETVLELVHCHSQGNADNNYPFYGINIKKGGVSNMLDENVVMPYNTMESIITLACETVIMILKIEDIVLCR